MSKASDHYIRTRSVRDPKGRSPVDVTFNAINKDRREELLNKGFVPLDSRSAEEIATYTKVTYKLGPSMTKVMADGTTQGNVVYVPAWLHAFFRRFGAQDVHIPRILELKEDRRAQLLLVGRAVLAGELTSLECIGYQAFIERLRSATRT